MICSVTNCGRVVRARSFCTKHYARYMKHGSPHKVLNRVFKSPEESFAARTEWQGDCLIWTGGKTVEGYGRIWVEGKMYPTHRYAWEREHGPIPEGMVVDHKDHCNTLCCNVEHLRVATYAQNNTNRSGPVEGSLTGHRNVYITRSGRFEVKIMKKHFGTYSTAEEAAKVAEDSRLELFGEFAGRG